MIDNSDFKKVVESLKLKNPNAEISSKTGHDKGNVSKYLSNKLRPSKKFLQLFCEKYNISYNKYFTEKPDEQSVSEDSVQYNKQNNKPPPNYNYDREMIAVLMEGNALMRVRNEQHEKQQEAMMTMLSTLTKTIVSNSETEAAKAKALAIQNKTILRMMEEVLAATLKKPIAVVSEMTNKIRHEVLMEFSD